MTLWKPTLDHTHTTYPAYTTRRSFLQMGLGATMGAGLSMATAQVSLSAFAAEPKTPSESIADSNSADLNSDHSNSADLIRNITTSVVFNGRKTGGTWFQPRACRVPHNDGSDFVLMTLQKITGSDNYGTVHWTTSTNGTDWSEPTPIASFERRPLPNAGWEEGVCDVVPEYHPQTQTVLAMGHNVYYKNNVLASPQRSRWPVYVVRSADCRWSDARRLEWNDPRGRYIYTCGCAQRLTLKNGDVLIPMAFTALPNQPRSVTSMLCGFDGRTLTFRTLGNVLAHSVKRGLLEPSLACFDGRYYMTIRAEDDRGYVAVSEDGLEWKPQQPWLWDDGEPVAMSTTQQRWLPHSEGLYLVYTRQTEKNMHVMRWRAPLFVAAVDPRTLRLIRSTERIVFPLIGDGLHDGKHVAGMGNFHTVAVNAEESWVTVGEERSNDDWNGDTLLGRVAWTRPNRIDFTAHS